MCFAVVPFNTSNLDYPCEETGVFPHPYACSKYVYCDSKLLAFEKDCPLCTDEAKCSGERLNFNPETGLCDLTSDSRCPPTTTTPKPSGNECVPECQQKGDCNCFETCVESKCPAFNFNYTPWNAWNQTVPKTGFLT